MNAQTGDIALTRIFRVVNGGTPTAAPEHWDGPIPWATPMDLATVDGGVVGQTNRTLTPAGLSQGSATVPAGSLLVSTRAPIGYVAMVDETTAFNQGCRGLVPRGEVDVRYFAYQLQARRPLLEADGQGSTFVELSSASLAAARLLRPELSDQRRIADFLDAETARIDALTAKKRRMIDLIAARSRSIRADLVLNGVSPIAGPHDSGTPWRTCSLGVLIQLHRGFDLPSDKRRPGSVPVVTSGGVSATHDEPACSGPGVVTGRYGTIGAVYWVDEPFWPLNTTLFVSDFRGRDPRWVYHLLTALPLNIDEEKSAVTGINRNVIGQLRVPVPPLEEQRRVAAKIDQEFARSLPLSQKLDRQIELLQERRQALITAAVTGQLPVPV